jgi:polyphosphate glucokinase
VTAAVGYGVDIGGSGIKGARVDLATGELIGERDKILTPRPATPDSVVAVVHQLVEQAGWTGPYGCTFPGIVKNGVLHSAANLDGPWVGTDLEKLLEDLSGVDVAVLNDADAAGLAEVRFGAAKGRPGLVLVTTLGTGIGSALIYDGVLVPNAELGHVLLHGDSAEKYAASSAKEREGLSYKVWAKRLQEYYSHVAFLLSPDLIVVGGGISRKSDKFLPLLDLPCEIVPAELRNTAGIVGAAMAAAELAEARGHG